MNNVEIIKQSMSRYFCTMTYFFDYSNLTLTHVVFICIRGSKMPDCKQFCPSLKERALCYCVHLFRWNKSQICQADLNAKLCNLCLLSFEINEYAYE